MSDNFLTLTETPRALAAIGFTITYQNLWRAVTEGVVPAEKVGKRWMIREADLEAIAATLTKV